MFDPKKASFRTWMYRIASNKICDHYRSKAHHLSLKQEQIDMTDKNLEFHSGNLKSAILCRADGCSLSVAVRNR